MDINNIDGANSFRMKCKLCIEVLKDYEYQNLITEELEQKIFEIFPFDVSFGKQLLNETKFSPFLSCSRLEICRSCCVIRVYPIYQTSRCSDDE